jgi:hypothetical protein
MYGLRWAVKSAPVIVSPSIPANEKSGRARPGFSPTFADVELAGTTTPVGLGTNVARASVAVELAAAALAEDTTDFGNPDGDGAIVGLGAGVGASTVGPNRAVMGVATVELAHPATAKLTAPSVTEDTSDRREKRDFNKKILQVRHFDDDESRNDCRRRTRAAQIRF